jgi:hypothetical protein
VTNRSIEVVSGRKAAEQHANRLLGLLPRADYQRLLPHLQPVPLEYRQSLYEANKPIGFVYFIETGVGSLVNTMANGQAAEVGTIGSEGMVGLPLVLGDNRAPSSVYIQVPGAGLRMKATLFKRELAQSASETHREPQHHLVRGERIASPEEVVGAFDRPCLRGARAREECQAGTDIERIGIRLQSWRGERRRAGDHERRSILHRRIEQLMEPLEMHLGNIRPIPKAEGIRRLHS